ncbi:MAG TPA: IclR family transcriptional regulator [Solirubrobacterales bacterium]|nr:IclR family transcriptional regulator [Solirubrobacterales bacterium]
MPEPRDNSVQTIVKAAALLDAMASRREASASELAEDLGEPRSSVYRMLASLHQLGYVDPGAQRGTYRLGLKLLRLGSMVQARLDVRGASLPAMERIHDETDETVFLCLRRGGDAVCVERLDGRRVTSLALQLGGSLPLHAGAGPRILLAFDARESWHRYMSEHELESFSPSTPDSAEKLIAVLEETRRNGYSVSDEDVTPGIAALGAPVFDGRGKIAAALSISGVRDSILGERAERVKELVVDGAAEISRALGYEPGEAGPPPTPARQSAS